MTKQKHAAMIAARRKKSAAASKRYRENTKKISKIAKAVKPLSEVALQASVRVTPVADIITRAITRAVDAAAERFSGDKSNGQAVDRMIGEGGNYPMAADAPAMSRIASLIDRLHSINSDLGKIRADNGELLQSNLGYREKGFGPLPTTAGKTEPVSKLGSVEDMLGFISEKICDIGDQGKLFNTVLG